MAKLECVIQYDEKSKTATATYNVLKVDQADEITFKALYPNTGIKYVNGSPFSGSDGPQVGVVFNVSEHHESFFKVTVPSNGEPRHFVCGEVGSAFKEKAVGPYEKTDHEFTPWEGGGDTP
jgi:hypothetical protein